MSLERAETPASAVTIYVDMDDVLCQTARNLLVIVEREFGKRIAYERLTAFDLGQACGLRPDEHAALLRLAHRPEELLRIPPVEGASDVLNRWAAAGYEIAIVTGRPPETRETSLAWLARHGIPYHSFTIVDKYGRFAADNTAAVTLESLACRGYCWAVEDSPAVALYLAERMGLPVALFGRPWNRAYDKHALITRYPHWPAIARAFPAAAAS